VPILEQSVGRERACQSDRPGPAAWGGVVEGPHPLALDRRQSGTGELPVRRDEGVDVDAEQRFEILATLDQSLVSVAVAGELRAGGRADVVVAVLEHGVPARIDSLAEILDERLVLAEREPLVRVPVVPVVLRDGRRAGGAVVRHHREGHREVVPAPDPLQFLGVGVVVGVCVADGELEHREE
jgi:hypothetical protein